MTDRRVCVSLTFATKRPTGDVLTSVLNAIQNHRTIQHTDIGEIETASVSTFTTDDDE